MFSRGHLVKTEKKVKDKKKDGDKKKDEKKTETKEDKKSDVKDTKEEKKTSGSPKVKRDKVFICYVEITILLDPILENEEARIN